MSHSFTLIELASIFAPEERAEVSILMAGGVIVAIGAIDKSRLSELDVDVVDGRDCIAIPGLIDPHVHLIGGSGEKGFDTQTPEVFFHELIRGGVTTVVGTLGVDTTTREMPALIAKAKGLKAQGLSAFVWTGGYDIPPRTVTGNVRDDIVLIEEVIGCGELAIADVRSAQPTPHELARMATDCYNGGLFTGKAGLLHLHVGDGKSGLGRVRQTLEMFDVAVETFYPTHVQRNETLMKEAIDFARSGGTIDFDVYDADLTKWLRLYVDSGAPLERVTISTDSAVNTPSSLLEQLLACVKEKIVAFPDAVKLATLNTARTLKLSDRGELAVGKRADVLLLDRGSLSLREVFAQGIPLMRGGELMKRETFLAENRRSVRLDGGKK